MATQSRPLGATAFTLLALLVNCTTGAPRSGLAPDARQLEGRPGQRVGRLPQIAEPVAYDLRLRVDPRLPRFSGQATLELVLRHPSRRVHFHAVAMRIHRVQAEVQGRRIRGAIRPVPGATQGEHAAVFSSELPRGHVRLLMDYDAPFDENLAGLYRARQGGRWYAYTQFEAADARKAFPCLDEPGWKVPVRLALTVPATMQAFANTPARRRQTEGEWTTIQFLQSKPLPTYLVAFVVGEIEVVHGPPGRVPLRALVPPGKGAQARQALKIAAAQLAILERYFGIPYPYRKLDLAALVEFGSGAMENAGLITFREENLLLDPARASEQQKRRVAGTIAHELAHQWFGNLVTMAWWDDLWLNEALATWIGVKVLDQWRPALHQHEQLLRWRGNVFDTDALASARSVRQSVRTVAEAEAAFDGLTYVKGASVLTMIEAWTGAEPLRRGIQAYLRQHAWGSATADDLFRALDRATGRRTSAVASTFVDRAGVPMLRVSLDCPAGRAATVSFEQGRYLPLGSRAPAGLPKSGAWQVPVCLLYPQGDGVGRSCALLDRPTGELALPAAAGCPAWIYPNADESGYYHWSVDRPRLKALVREAASPRSRLPSASRAALLEKAWVMTATGHAAPAHFLEALEQMRNSRDRRVIGQLIASLHRVHQVWQGTTSTPSFRRFARRLLEPAARRLGWSARRAEALDQRLLRPELLDALGRYGRPGRLLAWASRLARRYLARPAAVDAELAPVALALAAGEGAVTATSLLRFIAGASSPSQRVNALQALARVPAGRPLTRALAALLDGSLRAQDSRYLLEPIFRRAEARQQVLTFVAQNFAALARRLPTFGRASLSRLPGYIGALCDGGLLQRAVQFFGSRPIPGGRRSLSAGQERALQCVALRGAGEDDAAAYLLGPEGHERARTATLETVKRPNR